MNCSQNLLDLLGRQVSWDLALLSQLLQNLLLLLLLLLLDQEVIGAICLSARILTLDVFLKLLFLNGLLFLGLFGFNLRGYLFFGNLFFDSNRVIFKFFGFNFSNQVQLFVLRVEHGLASFERTHNLGRISVLLCDLQLCQASLKLSSKVGVFHNRNDLGDLLRLHVVF